MQNISFTFAARPKIEFQINSKLKDIEAKELEIKQIKYKIDDTEKNISNLDKIDEDEFKVLKEQIESDEQLYNELNQEITKLNVKKEDSEAKFTCGIG